MKRRDYKNLIILEIISIFLVLFLVKGQYIFGSSKDFISQHFLFADYFRNLFYETGKIFPQFAFNIGNGQNIFYFGYYGLYSPIFLISYLVPFIKTSTYIQISMLILIIFTIHFYYRWAIRRFDSTISFIISLALLVSMPIVFHATRHIMFISYFPFLLLGLYGIDEFYKNASKKSKLMITFSILGMILSNYVFAITEILSLFIYGVYVYLEQNDFSFKEFIINIMQIVKPIIFGILFSLFYLLPTAYAVINGRIATSTNINFLNLLIPNFNLVTYLYSPYGYGTGLLLLFALIHMLFKKNVALKVLSIILLVITIIPIFPFMFNSGMYIEYKAFIPFLPLYGLILGYFIKDISNVKLLKLSIILVIAIVMISSIINFKYYILIDLLAILVVLVFLLKNNIMGIIIISLYFIIFGFISIFSRHDLILKKDFNSLFNNSTYNQIKEVIKEDNNIYRFNYNNGLVSTNNIVDINHYSSFEYSSLSNLNNRKSYLNIFKNEVSYRNSMVLSPSTNVLYNIYTGNRYLYTNKNEMYGYAKQKNNIYKNESAFPIGYSTYKVMNLKYYKTLKYPQNIEALMNYVIVDENRIINDYESNISEYNYNIDSLIKDNKYIVKKNNKYIINNSKEEDLVIDIPEDKTISNKILFISFNMDYNQSCEVGDQIISIMGQNNVYTCKEWKYNNKNKNFTYTISLDQIKNKKIKFSPGKYIISNIRLYILDYDNVKDIRENFDEFMINKKKTKANKIVGSVDTKEYGYFNLSIPYDSGFEIYLDGKTIGYKKTDLNYIGFKVSPGHHDIVITYKAPFSKFGRVLTSISILIFLVYLHDDELLKQSLKIKNRFDVY